MASKQNSRVHRSKIMNGWQRYCSLHEIIIPETMLAVPVEFFSSSYAGNKFSSQYQVIHQLPTQFATQVIPVIFFLISEVIPVIYIKVVESMVNVTLPSVDEINFHKTMRDCKIFVSNNITIKMFVEEEKNCRLHILSIFLFKLMVNCFPPFC